MTMTRRGHHGWGMVAASGLIGAAVAGGPIASAQPPTGRQGMLPGMSPARDEPRAPVVSVDFRGGSVREYVAALSQAQGGTANVVPSARASVARLAPIVLRDVPLVTAVYAMRAAGAEAGSWQIESLPGTVSQEAFEVDVRPTGISASIGPVGPQLEIFSLRAICESQPGDPVSPGFSKPVEVVLAAVEAAARMAGDADEPAMEMKFHRDAGILACRGKVAQLSAAQRALETMRQDVEQQRSMTLRPTGLEAVEARAQANQAEALVGLARQRVELAEQRLAQSDKLHQQGHVPESEVNQHRTDLVAANVELVRATNLADVARARVEMLDTAGGRGDAFLDAVTALFRAAGRPAKVSRGADGIIIEGSPRATEALAKFIRELSLVEGAPASGAR